MIIKKLHASFFNTDRVLIWRLILEEYGLDIEYILGNKNVVAYALRRFTNNGNQENPNDSAYKNIYFCKFKMNQPISTERPQPIG